MTTDNEQHPTDSTLRFPRREERFPHQATPAHGFSIVMAVHDQGFSLEQNLHRFLNMESEADYEVIVVDDSSTDDTPDVLMRLKADYPRLYTTFLPRSVVFNPSRQQLALTIGAKAAKFDRIILADIHRPPSSEGWLAALAEATNEAVLIYSRRKEEAPLRFQQWDELDSASPLIRKAERRSGRGHQGRWLKFSRGLYDALVVDCSLVHDAIHLFDQQPGASTLWGLRLSTYWKNLFNKA